ncbi:coiled-coil domain-containing protein, partial [Helicobacter bizzozeronii]|uniref:hypothetical protein n=1 Tax=Helicobacter bizzozeronii TaxID=56877 RepID=UPI0013151DB3
MSRALKGDGLTISDLLTKIQELERANTRYTQQVADLDKELTEAREKFNSVLDTYVLTPQDKEQLGIYSNQKLKEIILGQNAVIADRDQHIAQITQQNTALEAKNAELLQNQENQKNAYAQASKAKGYMIATLATQVAQQHEQRIAELEDLANTGLNVINAHEQQIATLKQDLEDKKQVITTLKQKNTQLQSTLTDNIGVIAKETRIAHLEQDLKNQAQLHANALKDKKQEIAKLKQENAQLKKSNTDQQQKIMRLTTSLAQSGKKIQELQNTIGQISAPQYITREQYNQLYDLMGAICAILQDVEHIRYFPPSICL